MLSLSDHIGSYHPRVCRPVGQDQDLAGTSRKIDLHRASGKHLGGSDIDIARPHDLVHPFNAICAQSHGRYRLSPSELIDLVSSCHIRSSQRQWIDRSVFLGRGADHNPGHISNLGGNDGHQGRTGVGRPAPGNVSSNRIQRNDLLAHQHPGRCLAHPEVMLFLFIMEIKDMIRCRGERLKKPVIHQVV